MTNHLSGAFIAFDPGTYPTGARRVIPFRFNPETLQRSLSVESGSAPAGTDTGEESAGEDGGGAWSGSVKESFNVQVRLDFHDRHAAAQRLPPELGIAPEIAALEELVYPVEPPSREVSDGTEAVQQQPSPPTVLFVWGKKRVLPVRITSMTIHETLFNRELNPLRAEIEVALEVLGTIHAQDSIVVGDALAFTASRRRQLSRLFLENSADHGGRILPL